MEHLRCLPSVHVVNDSSDEVGEWIPTRQDFIRVYNRVHISRTPFAPTVSDIIPTSSKIGKRTFVEGCFDVVLLLACWARNVLVVSYLLASYIQYFSIDTLMDKLPVYDLKHAPALYGSKGGLVSNNSRVTRYPYCMQLLKDCNWML